MVIDASRYIDTQQIQQNFRWFFVGSGAAAAIVVVT